MSTANF